MAAIVGEYVGVSDVGHLGAVGNAFGLYTHEPPQTTGTAVTAVTAAIVADGDVAISSGSRLYLDATTNWRKNVPMDKGGKSIYINANGNLAYHDGTTEYEINITPV